MYNPGPKMLMAVTLLVFEVGLPAEARHAAEGTVHQGILKVRQTPRD